jgi:hypothetical protein
MPDDELHAMTMPDDHEHSAWWRKVMAEAEAYAATLRAEGVAGGITITLDPAEPRTCCRCRTHVPESEWFGDFDQLRADSVLVVGGLCEACLRLEGVEPPPSAFRLNA